MRSARPHRWGRLVAAIVVSLSLHALVGLGWLNAWGGGSVAGPGINPVVDGPDDHEIAFVLCEPRPEPPPKAVPPTIELQLSPPAALPPPVLDPPKAGTGAVSLVSGSPAPAPDLPKFGGAKALHGRPRAGTTVVYLLDRSGSMGPDGLLARAADAVRASLAELGPDTRFQIVAYNGGTAVLAAEPLRATPEAQGRASDWLNGLTAEGGSKHLTGFREALAARPDAVFLLTDADDLEESDVRAIAGLIQPPVRLSAAVFGGHRPAADTPLERLTRKLGGSIVYVGP